MTVLINIFRKRPIDEPSQIDAPKSQRTRLYSSEEEDVDQPEFDRPSELETWILDLKLERFIEFDNEDEFMAQIEELNKRVGKINKLFNNDRYF